MIKLYPIAIRLTKCVMILIVIRVNEDVMKVSMCDEGVDICPFVFDCVPEKMCVKVVFEKPFMLKYYLNRCNTQEMCDKAVDVCLPVLKFVPNLFVSNKMLENLNNYVLYEDNVVIVNTYSDNFMFVMIM